MDLATLDNRRVKDSGIPLDVTNPRNGKKIGLRIWVASMDSQRVTDLRNSITNERLRDLRDEITAEEQTAIGERILAATITRWEFGNDDSGEKLTLDGKTPEHSQDEAEKLIRRFSFIADQVTRKARNQSGFFADSESSSAGTQKST